jgi:hypothetical protein
MTTDTGCNLDTAAGVAMTPDRPQRGSDPDIVSGLAPCKHHPPGSTPASASPGVSYADMFVKRKALGMALPGAAGSLRAPSSGCMRGAPTKPLPDALASADGPPRQHRAPQSDQWQLSAYAGGPGWAAAQGGGEPAAAAPPSGSSATSDADVGGGSCR